MNVSFVKVSSIEEFNKMTRDPHTFYIVAKDDGKDYTLRVGLYSANGEQIKTWGELKELGLDVEKDYEDPTEEGSGTEVLDTNNLEGELGISDEVEEIGDKAFENSDDLTEVEIPESVKRIGSNAFANNPNLESVIIEGNDDLVIEDGAFQNDTKLESVKIINGVDTIGTNAFKGDTNLTTVELPESVKKIESQAFAETGLESINIPDTVEEIAEDAFKDTPAEENGEIYYGDKLIQEISLDFTEEDSADVVLEKGYIYKITALYDFVDDVTKQSTITSSDENVVKFIPDYYLKPIDVGSAIISGTYHAPSGVSKHAEIHCKVVEDGGDIVEYEAGLYDSDWTLKTTWADLISSGVLSVKSGVLTSKYTSYTQTTNNIKNTIEANDSSNKLDGTLVIDKSVTRIGSNGLRNCRKLQHVVIPDSVTYIGSHAFDQSTLTMAYRDAKYNLIPQKRYASSSLTLIELPDTITNIDDYGLAYNSNLTVTYPNSISDYNNITKSSSYNSNANITVQCNDGDYTYSN